MSIEVDVTAQLIPNPFTMAFTLLVTAVIFFFAYKFLWGPARELLAKRQAYYEDKIKSADEMNAEATNNLEESKQALKKADTLAEEIKASAKAEAEAMKNDIVAKGRRQADDYIDRAKERMAKERDELMADINEQIVEVALAASEKLLESKDMSSLDKKAIERFIEGSDDGDK